jgi:hypothetical protein
MEQVTTSIDPIVTAINNYRAGLRDFDARAFPSEEDADAYMLEMIEPHFDVLKAWDQPAETFAGAVAALELADHELARYADSMAVPRMVKAALAFFKLERTPQYDVPVTRATVASPMPEAHGAQGDASHPLATGTGAAC